MAPINLGNTSDQQMGLEEYLKKREEKELRDSSPGGEGQEADAVATRPTDAYFAT
eukprot:CAMPEP_0176083302 /NCGR_PEP_ID=MMETSP0120_2-20121206/41676_1 /TAXON_ID=160619 /ORGANISM="Kryptoperidinium foliaceum, Strain CCMP 1326" /LENGTH=54 /DNA_ID=CAMNT_0017417085 /DNA_START=139 /DNA_END=303 /DNA_ORIENTATION=-